MTSLPILESYDEFAHRLHADGQELRRGSLTTLQLNIGKMCNLACHHCHVEAGPGRTEIMTWETMERICDWIEKYRGEHAIETVDLTGGAPEMNPHFRPLVERLCELGLHVIDRCNLTILLEAGNEDLPVFLAKHGVEISASLPCYISDNVDKQRGNGVFEGSIEALRRINAAGYGQPPPPEAPEVGGEWGARGLRLDLVYNPVGYGLPPDQAELERDYKQHLRREFGITFNTLWTITNMPIKRFEHALQRDGEYDGYMDRLIDAHRSGNVDQVMCRSLVSVGWQGSVYDCDFNQMLQMPLEGPEGAEEDVVESESRKLWEWTPVELVGRSIATGSHCFGCTAGAGSSCTGSLDSHRSMGGDE